MHRPRVR